MLRCLSKSLMSMFSRTDAESNYMHTSMDTSPAVSKDHRLKLVLGAAFQVEIPTPNESAGQSQSNKAGLGPPPEPNHGRSRGDAGRFLNIAARYISSHSLSNSEKQPYRKRGKPTHIRALHMHIHTYILGETHGRAAAQPSRPAARCSPRAGSASTTSIRRRTPRGPPP